MNEIAFDVITSIIQVIIVFVLMTQAFPAKYQNARNAWTLAVAVLICAGWQSLYAFIDISFLPNITPILICSFLYARLCRTGTWYIHLLIPALFTAATGAITVGVLGALSLVWRMKTQDFMMRYDTRLIATVILLLLYLPFVYLLAALARRWTHHRSLPLTTFACMLVMPVLIIGVLLMLADVQYGGTRAPTEHFSLLAALVMIVLNVIMIWLFDRMAKQAAESIHLRTETNLAKIQIRYQQEMDATYHQMQTWRHDSHNHIQTMLALLEMGKTDKLKTYMRTFADEFSGIEQFITSGNSMIDALLSAKRSIINKKGIPVEMQLQLPDNLTLPDSEMCILLGNLLDNAIEACERIGNSDDRFIHLRILPEGMHLRISLDNSTNGQLRRMGQVFRTEKDNDLLHGFGLRSINRIVEKHHGYHEYTHSNNVFSVTLLVPLRSV